MEKWPNGPGLVTESYNPRTKDTRRIAGQGCKGESHHASFALKTDCGLPLI